MAEVSSLEWGFLQDRGERVSTSVPVKWWLLRPVQLRGHFTTAGKGVGFVIWWVMTATPGWLVSLDCSTSLWFGGWHAGPDAWCPACNRAASHIVVWTTDEELCPGLLVLGPYDNLCQNLTINLTNQMFMHVTKNYIIENYVQIRIQGYNFC